jgi:hypothetical protein
MGLHVHLKKKTQQQQQQLGRPTEKSLQITLP